MEVLNSTKNEKIEAIAMEFIVWLQSSFHLPLEDVTAKLTFGYKPVMCYAKVMEHTDSDTRINTYKKRKSSLRHACSRRVELRAGRG